MKLNPGDLVTINSFPKTLHSPFPAVERGSDIWIDSDNVWDKIHTIKEIREDASGGYWIEVSWNPNLWITDNNINTVLYHG